MLNNLVDEITEDCYTAVYQEELYVLYCREEISCTYAIKKLNNKRQWETIESNIILSDVHIRSFFISPNGLIFIIFEQKRIEEDIQCIFKDINNIYSPWSYESFYDMKKDIMDYVTMSQRQFLYSQMIYGVINQEKQVRETIERFFQSKREESEEEKKLELKGESDEKKNSVALVEYEDIIYTLKEELDKTIEAKNTRIENLLDIIREKEKIIDRLYNLLKLTR